MSTSAGSDLLGLLEAASAVEASDLHLAAACAPLVRIDGRLRTLALPTLSAQACEDLCHQALALGRLRRPTSDCDFAFGLDDGTRIRASVFRKADTLAAALRLVPSSPPHLEMLGLPAACRSLAGLEGGLVLITGATGSGKSTTLAALIGEIRERRNAHIVTIEDPIEFVHPPLPPLMSQREVGRDVPDFATALRHVLRQDPDVVLVGELRDRETMRAGLTLAETGHLVLSTLHSTSAIDAADRLVDAFGADEQGRGRQQVATVLQAVVAQRLLPRRDGTGRVAACEVLVATPAVRNLIREGKGHQIRAHVQAAGRELGMQTMEAAVDNLIRAGTVAASNQGRPSPTPSRSLVRVAEANT